MTGWRGIEHEMIEGVEEVRVPEESSEFIESRDLQGTPPGKLLFHALDSAFRQDAPIRTHQTLSVLPRCLLGIDIEGTEPGYSGNLPGFRVQSHAQHFIEVRGRVRAYQ